MRSGHWRSGARLMVAAGLVVMLGVSTAQATDFFGNFRTIPRSAPAVDLRTGGPFQMPPVPYGHYAKDPIGHVAKYAGLAASPFHKAAGLAHAACAMCLGKGCGACGGLGIDKGCVGDACGHGLMKTSGCVDGACGPMVKHGLFGLLGHKESTAFVGNGGMPVASPQTHCISPQGLAPGKCGPGLGCADFGHGGGMVQPCGGCGGKGCGLCGGKGLHCMSCGGKGCGLCMDLLAKCKALLGMPHAMVARALHIGDIKYFVGPGGPVPLTPGYVPYVVPTRSPRDFLAFPPLGNGVQPDF